MLFGRVSNIKLFLSYPVTKHLSVGYYLRYSLSSGHLLLTPYLASRPSDSHRIVSSPVWFSKVLKIDPKLPFQPCVLSCFSCVGLFVPCRLRPTRLCPVFQQEYWSGLPCPSPGDLLDPGTEPVSNILHQAGRFFTTRATWEALSSQVYLPILQPPLPAVSPWCSSSKSWEPSHPLQC